MKTVLNENKLKASELEVPAEGLIPEVAVLRNVRVSYVTDADGNRTETIEFVRYDCVNPENYSNFTLKVVSTRPVVSQEMLESLEEPLFIAIPVSKTIIRPYSIEFGYAKVSIIAPEVKIYEG